MPRPPLARERVLDAFEALLIDDGERAATLDATARAAGVSKGGLLYHFGAKDDLVSGLLQRLAMLVDEDITSMLAAPEGPVAYYLRTSVLVDDPLDRTLVAVSRLAQGGREDASAALHEVRGRWADAIAPSVRDGAALDVVMLVSDGLYFNNALDREDALRIVPRGERMQALIAFVERVARWPAAED